MKEQLVFDTTDAESISHSDSVGAYVRGSDGKVIDTVVDGNLVDRLAVDAAIRDGNGDAITSTSGALDVNLKSPISIAVDLSHIDDSIRLGDGTDFFTSTTNGLDIGLDVNLINDSIVVTAANLDIRDLDYLSDSVTSHQGGVWDIGTVTSITNDVNIADGGNSITVDAVDLDIRDITAASDSIQSFMYDGAGTALTSTLEGGKQALDVNIVNALETSDAALANAAIASAANVLSVAGTAQDVVASPLASRKYLHIMNMDNKRVYVGQSGVTASNGYPLSPKASIMLRAGAAVDIEFVGSTGALPELRTLELS